MQISEILLARVGFFVDIRQLNPDGLSLQPIHQGLLERYKFPVHPINQTDFDFTKGVRYGGGQFKYQNKPIAVYLTMYNNGSLVETLVSTEAAEAFWDDLSTWVATLGFRCAKDIVTSTVYESQLVVQDNVDLAKKCGDFQRFVELIATLSGNPTEQFSGIYISADNSPLSTFTFERRVSTPFSENKYFSRATLPTRKHLRALEEFEKYLA
jgi:hypothetical protein